MASIKYVGSKPRKQDTVAGTGIWWLGYGDVQEVPQTAVARLLMHPDVWAMAEVSDGAGLALTGLLSGAADDAAFNAALLNQKHESRFVLDGPDGSVVLDAMDDDAVKAWVKANLEPHGIKVDGRAKGDKLKQAVIDAVKAVN